MTDADQPDYTVLTVQLLSAYVTNNMVPSADLAGLIQSTRAALVAQTSAVEAEPVLEYTPAVSVRKSPRLPRASHQPHRWPALQNAQAASGLARP